MCLGSRAGPRGLGLLRPCPEPWGIDHRPGTVGTDGRVGAIHGLPPSCPSKLVPSTVGSAHRPLPSRDSQAHGGSPSPGVSAWNHFKFWGGGGGVLKGGRAAVGSQSCTPTGAQRALKGAEGEWAWACGQGPASGTRGPSRLPGPLQPASALGWKRRAWAWGRAGGTRPVGGVTFPHGPSAQCTRAASVLTGRPAPPRSRSALA